MALILEDMPYMPLPAFECVLQTIEKKDQGSMRLTAELLRDFIEGIKSLVISAFCFT
jgi:hypothetical protein